MPWVVRVEDAEIQWHTFALQEKDGCYVSENTKLAFVDRTAILSSKALAERFAEALYPLMRKRHGAAVELAVMEITGAQVQTKSDVIVQARIDQKNFAPNKRPLRAAARCSCGATSVTPHGWTAPAAGLLRSASRCRGSPWR